LNPPAIKALVFDVFGTVVDWRGSIIREGMRLGRARKLDVDWAAFADAWRAGYKPAMARVRSGELPWTRIDDLHRLILDDILDKFAIGGLSPAEIADLNRVWHRLRPWPDARGGLQRLKRRYVIGTLSNGNIGLLVNMAKHGGLPWDVVFSAEVFRHYKPDPEVYLLVAFLIGAYVYSIRVIGPRAVPAGEQIVSRQNIGCFAGAMALLFAASTWPIHQIGENYLYSVHMLQHMMLSYFMPPLVLLATPTWLMRSSWNGPTTGIHINSAVRTSSVCNE
jgi:2-haloacid dehalogenase